MSFSKVSRREVLSRVGGGLGMLSLGSLLAGPAGAASKTPHFLPKAKRVIYLFMSGGPSQVDTFDPKPMLKKLEGPSMSRGAEVSSYLSCW